MEETNTGASGPEPIGNLRDKPSEIEVDIKKKPTDNKASFNVKSTSFIKDFVSQPTKQEDPTPAPGSAGGSVEEIRRRLEEEEKQEVNKLSVEDFEDAADFIIDLVDMAILFGIRWYSQDISDAEYKVPEEKLRKLKKHLSRVLMRVGKSFPMGMLLIFGILAAYATPVRKAHEHRKKVMAEKTRKKLKEVKENEEPFLDDQDSEYIPIKKRKRGGQPK